MKKRAIITVKSRALAVFIATKIEENFGNGKLSIDSGSSIDGYRVSAEYEDESINHITWFAVGIQSAISQFFL